MKRYQEQRKTLLFAIVICFVGCLLCVRVHFGLDLSDETHYFALAKRFAQGDRPFREEWFPAQIIGILLLPFYQIYNRLNGGIEGILLAARILFTIFHTIVSLVVFWILTQKERMEKIPAFLFSLCFLFYVRANIHSFSYYNVGLITFLLYLMSRKVKCMLAQMGSGIFFSVSVLCMPYLALYFLIMEIKNFVQIIRRKRECTEETVFLAGIGFCAIFFLGYILSLGNAGDIFCNLPEILKDPEHQGTMMESIFSFVIFMKNVFYKYLFWPMMLENVGILYYILRAHKEKRLKEILKWIAYMIFFLQAVYLRTFFEGGIMIAFFLLAAQIAVLERIYEEQLWKGYAFPGLMYGLVWMLGSNVGQRVFNLGCIISFIWAVTVIWKDSQLPQVKWMSVLKKGSIFWTFFILGCISFFDIYGDSSIERLTVKLETGAAKGIYTSTGRAEEYEKILDMLSKYAGKDRILAVGGVNPWIYLDSDARCGVQAVWRLDFSDERNDNYYERYPDKVPDVIFLLDSSYKTNDGWRYSSHGSYAGDAEKLTLKGSLQKLVEQESYFELDTECGIFYMREERN